MLRRFGRRRERALDIAVAAVGAGAGAGGVETLLAMQYALRATPSIAWHLIADTATIVPQHSAAVRDRLAHVLACRGIAVHAGVAAIGVDRRGVRIADGSIVLASAYARCTAGRWVWRWKDAIDRRYVATYHALG